jgi:Plasmid pRiA4b ORF-3-like protein
MQKVEFMRAYKIKIVLIDSNPSIWRRVIVPSKITFENLHEIIQFSMGWKNCYLYDFNLKEEKLRITNDKENIKEYENYSKLKLTPKNDPKGYIKKVLEIKPKLSSKVEIDKYLVKEKNIEYIYDFGDYWIHNVTLEEIVENYEYSYPICIEGEGGCPPEDVDGIPGYEKFLKIMKDKNHPEYEGIKQWAEKQEYKEEFNVETTNRYMADILK